MEIEYEKKLNMIKTKMFKEEKKDSFLMHPRNGVENILRNKLEMCDKFEKFQVLLQIIT